MRRNIPVRSYFHSEVLPSCAPRYFNMRNVHSIWQMTVASSVILRIMEITFLLTFDCYAIRESYGNIVMQLL